MAEIQRPMHPSPQGLVRGITPIELVLEGCRNWPNLVFDPEEDRFPSLSTQINLGLSRGKLVFAWKNDVYPDRLHTVTCRYNSLRFSDFHIDNYSVHTLASFLLKSS